MRAIEWVIAYSLPTVGIKLAFTAIKIISQYTNVRNVTKSKVIAYLLLKVNLTRKLHICNHNKQSMGVATRQPSIPTDCPLGPIKRIDRENK